MSGWNQSVNTVWMEPLGWSVLHSLWQISAITLLYALVLPITKRMPSVRRANLRYVAGCVALVTMVVGPVATFMLLLPNEWLNSPASQLSATEAVMLPVTVETQLRDPDFGPYVSGATSASVTARKLPLPLAHRITWLAVAWMVGVLIAAMRPLLGLWRVRQLKFTVHDLPDLQAVTQKLAERFGVRRAVVCVGTKLTEVPMLVGYLRPVILMPLSLATGLDDQQLQCLLAHELAHVRRHDYLLNLLQVVIETLLFFHPLMWWVSNRVRMDREYCTDDLVISVTGTQKSYVEALLELEHRRLQALPAVAASDGSLLSRTQRIIASPLGKEPRGNLAKASGRGFLSFVAVLAMLAATTWILQHYSHSSEPRDGEINSVKGDVVMSKKAIEKKFPVNDDLVWAANQGELDRVRELIEAGADPNSVDVNGMGALLNFHPKVTAYLLEKGANPDIQRNENILPVLVGVAGFNTKCVKLMLDAGANPNIACEHNGETALHHAAAGSDLELVKILLDAGANPNTRTKPGMTTYTLWRDARVRGETPLHRAAAWGSPEVIKLLLDGGANPTLRDANKDTPLSWASWHQRDKAIIDQLSYSGSGVGPDFPSDENELSLESMFWQSVVANDLPTVKKMLAEDSSLAGKDFRPIEKRDAHTTGFPLVHACHEGNYELAEVLLQYGADVDARSPTEDQREFGIPLFISVYDEGREPRYDLANLMLDHGASVDAYPYCHEPMVYWLYGAAMRASPDVVPHMVYRGLRKYLPDRQRDYPTLSDDTHEAVRLFDRVLSLGVELPLNSVIKHEHYELIEEMLRHDPEACFEALNGPANWYGYPKVWDLIMEICPEMHSYESAKSSIHAATKSHNRDGSYTDYRRLIEMQLKYLQERGQLEKVRTDESPYKAHHWLARNFCWHNNYGYRAEVSRPEHLLDLAELYISYGFEDFDYRDPETNRTPLATAIARGTHPGMLEYAEFLIQHGADLCLDDPEDTNPLALAKRIDESEHAERRAAFINLLGGNSQHASVTQDAIEQLRNACQQGNLEKVRKLITEQPHLIDTDDQHQWRPVFHAALNKHEPIVRSLIEAGADLSAHDGYVMHYAAEVPDNKAIVKLLVEHGALEAHVRPKDNLSRQLIHALFLSDVSRVGKLLERHARLSTTVDGLGDYPIHHAARNGETEIVRLLIKSGADVNARNSRGHTVLYCAGGHGHSKTVQLLLDKGADKQIAFTHDGKTLQQWLAQYPDDERLQEVAELLN